MNQPDLFGATRYRAQPQPETPDPDAIRRRLSTLLETVRAAREMPWEPARTRTQAVLLHNMANWLPEPERDSLRAAFTVEMERLRRD